MNREKALQELDEREAKIMRNTNPRLRAAAKVFLRNIQREREQLEAAEQAN